MEVIYRDWYCLECSLQFDSKSVFDLHLSLVHKEKLRIKGEQNLDPKLLNESEKQEELETFKSKTVGASEKTQYEWEKIDTKYIISNEGSDKLYSLFMQEL